MRLSCACGEEIVDEGDEVRSKAWVIPDADYAALWEDLARRVARLAEVHAKGDLRAWVAGTFGEAYAALDMELSAIAHDVLIGPGFSVAQSRYACPSCGRLHVEQPDGAFVSYVRE